MRVMFVDDEPINNQINKILFGKLYPQIEVVIKSSVDAALDYIKDPTTNNPDKILLDINLPVKSGWDFLAEFKELQIYSIDLYMLTSALDLLDFDMRSQYPEVKDFVEKPLCDYKIEAILNA